ncbi:hypothetical protein O3P69_013272 [Scylla paramamosain]|uniref:Transmembrane protein n=1 Tax=Scylla paramamosain TaxID=85552 RepID=A0AAW0U027_SCYPA
MAGGESLRAVLLKTSTSTAGGRSGGRRGASSRGTSSHVGVGVSGGGLTWRSLRSVSGTADTTDPQGHFFPAKLALSLGLIKLFLAILMVVLGALALVLNAAMATLGVGLWAGAVAGLAGFLGVCSSRRPYVQVYVVSFMCVAILCIVSSGLVIILSATAWARDNRHQRAVYVDQETQEEVEVLGEVLVQRPAVLVSGALVLLGVLDCIVSLACVAVCVKEACGLNSKGAVRVQGLSEGHNRKERLYRWLGQQKTIFPIGSTQGPPRGVSSISQFVPLSSSDSSSSATPRKALSDPTSPSSTLPSSTSHKIHKLGKDTSAPSHISFKTEQTSVPSILKPSALPILNHGSHSLPPPTTYLPTTKHQHLYPHPQDHRHSMHSQMPMPYPHQAYQHHFPPHAAHPSLYYPHLMTPMMPASQHSMDQEHHQRTSKKKEGRKHREKKEKHEKRKHKKAKKELTDEQIERTYTGLDRELAEEFIDNTMEPGLSIQRAFSNSFEQDSF